MSGLDVAVEMRGLTAVVTLAGEIDMATCPDLKAAAASVFQSSEVISEIIVDMGGVPFIDSTGVGCLVGIRNTAVERGIALRLRELGRGPRRVFEITELDTVFDIDDGTTGPPGPASA